MHGLSSLKVACNAQCSRLAWPNKKICVVEIARASETSIPSPAGLAHGWFERWMFTKLA